MLQTKLMSECSLVPPVVPMFVVIPVGARAWLRAPSIRGMVDRTLKEIWAKLLVVSLPTQHLPMALGPVLAATLVPDVTF